MTRRSNDKRIASLHNQMKDLMSIIALYERLLSVYSWPHFFSVRLRNVAANDQGQDGITVEARLSKRLDALADMMKQCGKVCDSMEKSGFLSMYLSMIGGGALIDCVSKSVSAIA